MDCPPIPETVTLEVDPDVAANADALRRRIAAAAGVDAGTLPEHRVARRSIDARRGRVRLRLVVRFDLPPAPEQLAGPPPRTVTRPERVLVVGDGPAGLFCAYALARRGIGSTVVDRGKPVRPRRRDLKGLNQHGTVDPDSNYCFGEGGAGTYSDGKLYTRSLKRGDVHDVLGILAAHGAPQDILVDARPHVGSNRLPRVVTALREHLERVGVVFRFSTRVTELVVRERGAGRAVIGARTAAGDELPCEALVLATGHSARDVHGMLTRAGVELVPKPFALGVRIEHPQPLVDAIQYGRYAGHAALPAAAYRVATEVDHRGVFSFCMCPGGFVVPASTAPGELVVNGMSLSRRDSPFANSGLVVAVEVEDLARSGRRGPRAGVELQRAVESAAWEAGGGALVAPATRATDFIAGRGSTTVPRTSYQPGIVAADVAEVLDVAGLPFAARLRRAVRDFERRLRGYLTEEAVLIGVESRTSSPVRVPRDPDTLVSPDLAGLYPAGEGAGAAGGIVSAALDGTRIAERIAAALRPSA